MELRSANLRLRGVVADMRREMEALRDPGMRGDDGARERRLAEENEELRSVGVGNAGIMLWDGTICGME